MCVDLGRLWIMVSACVALAAGCGRIGFEVVGAHDGVDPSDAAAAPGATLDGSADADGGSTVDASGLTGMDASTGECGNGSVEGSEQCDDQGESAVCDDDCTHATCGDGMVNATAGEACDDGDDLSSCAITCQPLSCRAGCQCEWYLGTRYMFCAEELAWNPASDACAEEGMRLVRIDSGPEQTWLRLRTLRDGMTKFQLGATDAAEEGVWTDLTPLWAGDSSGMALAYEDFANGSPSGVGSQRCLAVLPTGQ